MKLFCQLVNEFFPLETWLQLSIVEIWGKETDLQYWNPLLLLQIPSQSIGELLCSLHLLRKAIFKRRLYANDETISLRLVTDPVFEAIDLMTLETSSFLSYWKDWSLFLLESSIVQIFRSSIHWLLGNWWVKQTRS